MAGDKALAQAALAELKRAQPNVSCTWIAANMPIRHEAERDHYLNAFRKAGLA
jgi:ADP-heptose:LPS heptosyltransferase